MQHVAGAAHACALVCLEVSVDVSYESERRKEPDGAHHEEEDKANNEHVAKEEGRL